jgi:hypothetical protein
MQFYTLCHGIFYVNVQGMQATLSITVLVKKETLLYG